MRVTVSHCSMEKLQSGPIMAQEPHVWHLDVTSFELITLLTAHAHALPPQEKTFRVLQHKNCRNCALRSSPPAQAQKVSRGTQCCCSSINTRLRGVLFKRGLDMPAGYRRVSPCPPLPLWSTTVSVATNRTGASSSSPPLLILLPSAVSLGSTADAASGTRRATRPISDGGHACVAYQTTRGTGRGEGREV